MLGSQNVDQFGAMRLTPIHCGSDECTPPLVIYLLKYKCISCRCLVLQVALHGQLRMTRRMLRGGLVLNELVGQLGWTVRSDMTARYEVIDCRHVFERIWRIGCYRRQGAGDVMARHKKRQQPTSFCFFHGGLVCMWVCRLNFVVGQGRTCDD
jgi:hypothetical protein